MFFKMARQMCFALILPSLFIQMVSTDFRVRISPDKPLSEDTLNHIGEGSMTNPKTLETMGIYDQTVSGNSIQQTVQLDLTLDNGVMVTQLTDFNTQAQILKIVIPGELDLEQIPFKTFCFVSAFTGDMISPHSVAKLRQNNPKTIRLAEEDRGDVVQYSPILVNPSIKKTSIISPHLASFCQDAKEAIFSSEHELFNIFEAAKLPNSNVTEFGSEAFEGSENLPRCFIVQDWKLPCVCSLKICLHWFPCELKYCQDKNGDKERRCGIKSCRKCFTFRFPIREKNSCMWDNEA